MNTITVVPAYGRDYNSKEAVVTSWENGSDFKVATTGQYIGKSELSFLKANNVSAINFRYSKLSKSTLMEIQ